jgi:hypothetical protein
MGCGVYEIGPGERLTICGGGEAEKGRFERVGNAKKPVLN